MPRTRLSEAEVRSLQPFGATRGTRRQYVVTATGEVVSRRQAEQAQREYGLREKIAPLAPRSQSRYQLLISDRQKALKEEGLNVSKRDIRNDPETRQHIKDMKRYNAGKDKDSSANGKMAHALVYFGLRDEDDDWDVGDTPDIYAGG